VNTVTTKAHFQEIDAARELLPTAEFDLVDHTRGVLWVVPLYQPKGKAVGREPTQTVSSRSTAF
jgi:hypothetical protein